MPPRQADAILRDLPEWAAEDLVRVAIERHRPGKGSLVGLLRMLRRSSEWRAEAEDRRAADEAKQQQAAAKQQQRELRLERQRARAASQRAEASQQAEAVEHAIGRLTDAQLRDALREAAAASPMPRMLARLERELDAGADLRALASSPLWSALLLSRLSAGSGRRVVAEAAR